jgi:hypothetical protein
VGQIAGVFDIEGDEPPSEGLGDDQRLVIRRDHHAVGEYQVACDLASRAVRGDQCDDAGCGRLAGEEAEADAVEVDVAPAIDHNLVPEIGEPAQVGSRRSSSLPVTSRRPSGSQSMAQPRPAGPWPVTRAVTVEVDCDDLARL